VQLLTGALTVEGANGPMNTIPTDPSEDNDQLAALRQRFPAWVIWHGQVTGHYWAQPPAGHPDQILVSADDLTTLAERITEADRRQPLS
jgi:hypothetical protein